MEREERVELASPLRRRYGRLAGWVWVAFLGFPLASLLSSKVSTTHLVLVLIGFGACLAGYSTLLFENRLSASVDVARAIVFALFLISVLLTAFDRGGWATVLVYATAAMAIRRLFSERVAFALVLGFSAIAALLILLRDESAGTAITVGVTCSGIGLLLIGVGELRARNVELLRARDERAKLAVAEERLRFARDMHDLLGHSLSVIALRRSSRGACCSGTPRRRLSTSASSRRSRAARSLRSVTPSAAIADRISPLRSRKPGRRCGRQASRRGWRA